MQVKASGIVYAILMAGTVSASNLMARQACEINASCCFRSTQSVAILGVSAPLQTQDTCALFGGGTCTGSTTTATANFSLTIPLPVPITLPVTISTSNTVGACM
ncbi:hypothetical protein QCA50_010265 [Cerrena zonata]|uniref:Hydrophobin n=1 Tax=Cerrena zonata TaxID=2478898 RepID=A0AAW0GC77_9APHY